MIPELGHLALILALLLSLVLALLAGLGAQRGVAAWVALARPVALGQCGFMLVAWGCLVASFVASDFSVRNVAENANTLLPLPYRVAAAWGSHEGSLMLWLTLQSLWLAAAARFNRAVPAEMLARVLAVMAALAAALQTFVLTTSNPFLRVFPIPAQGRDLNPLLQDPGMALHPPLLYMGYAGLSVSFGFALAALWGGRGDTAWARWARPWTTLAWCCLTAGVALGSGWAYYELGWGGWWFWDPVENAAFMPWLVATALVHALALADRRGLFQAWAVMLAILGFSLALVGTFLVRSGVLSSVHAFAIDPRRGTFILVLLVVLIGGSLGLFARRASTLARGGPLEPVSRETLMLAGSLLLLVAAGTVLLGTFYPLVMEVFGAAKVSVGPPYFEAVFVPLMAPVVVLMAVAPMLRWQRGMAPELWRRLGLMAAAAVLVAAVLPSLAGGGNSAMLALGLWLATWVVLATAWSVVQTLHKMAQGQGGPKRAWWGMTLAHLGVAVFVAGVTGVKGYQTELDLRMAPGDTATVGRHQIRFEGVTPVQGPNYSAEQGRFAISLQGRPMGTLSPEKRRYASMPGTAMTESAIVSTWRGDLYLALGDALGQGAWTVRAYDKPWVTWIWGGCALMALGGLMALRFERKAPHPRAG